MNTTIQKWGNSLAVRLPKEVVRSQVLHEGSRVQVATDNGRIVITLAPKEDEKVDLTSLLRDITADNVHGEQEWMAPKGNEVW